MPKEYVLPDSFGTVEEGVYRSSTPEKQHFEFIKSLNLKTFLHLSQEILTKPVKEFFQQNKIEFVFQKIFNPLESDWA